MELVRRMRQAIQPRISGFQTCNAIWCSNTGDSFGQYGSVRCDLAGFALGDTLWASNSVSFADPPTIDDPASPVYRPTPPPYTPRSGLLLDLEAGIAASHLTRTCGSDCGLYSATLADLNNGILAFGGLLPSKNVLPSHKTVQYR